MICSIVRDYTLKDVRIDDVRIGFRHRQPTDEAVAKVAGSINEIGLREPITCRYATAPDGERTIELCAGLTRLRACQSLGWETIPCNFQDFGSTEEAELWEIDENLMRGELSPAEEAAHLSRRKELFIIIGGTNSPTKPQYEKGFAQDTAEKTGENKREINRKIARAAALGEDISAVVGTSLDKGTELDALAKMQEPDRRLLIARAASGASVSAVREIRSEHDVATQQFNALMTAWNRAGKEARQRFLETVDAPVFGAA